MSEGVRGSERVGRGVSENDSVHVNDQVPNGIPNHKHILNEFLFEAPGPWEIHRSDMAFEA